MADTYRPLREDDPVGIEVWSTMTYESTPRLLGPVLLWGRFSQVCVEVGQGIEVWNIRHLVVRVREPDPWGELLEAAKWAEKELAGCRVSNIHMHNQLGVAIAAVEAQKEKKS